MTVYRCDSEVVLKMENVKAVISAIEIRRKTVHYETTYFDGHERKKVWVNEEDFICGDKKQKIGFK